MSSFLNNLSSSPPKLNIINPSNQNTPVSSRKNTSEETNKISDYQKFLADGYKPTLITIDDDTSSISSQMSGLSVSSTFSNISSSSTASEDSYVSNVSMDYSPARDWFGGGFDPEAVNVPDFPEFQFDSNEINRAKNALKAAKDWDKKNAEKGESDRLPFCATQALERAWYDELHKYSHSTDNPSAKAVTKAMQAATLIYRESNGNLIPSPHFVGRMMQDNTSAQAVVAMRHVFSQETGSPKTQIDYDTLFSPKNKKRAPFIIKNASVEVQKNKLTQELKSTGKVRHLRLPFIHKRDMTIKAWLPTVYYKTDKQKQNQDKNRTGALKKRFFIAHTFKEIFQKYGVNLLEQVISRKKIKEQFSPAENK